MDDVFFSWHILGVVHKPQPEQLVVGAKAGSSGSRGSHSFSGHLLPYLAQNKIWHDFLFFFVENYRKKRKEKADRSNCDV